VIIAIMVAVLLVGIGCGAVLADRLYQAGAAKAAKRALERLEYTLDGLETAYLVQAARLACEKDLGQPRFGGSGRYDAQWPVHLPQQDADNHVPRIPRAPGPLGRRGRSGGPTGSVRPDR
jgi:hypothetical protein